MSSDELITQFTKETDVFNKAKILSRLKSDGVRTKDISKLTGLHASYICHLLRLNRLPEIVKDGYYSELISLGHLFELSRVKDRKSVLALYERILGYNLSVRKTDEAVREILYSIKTEGEYLSTSDKDILVSYLKLIDPDSLVNIYQSRIKTKITIEFSGSLKRTSELFAKLLENISLPVDGKQKKG